MTPLSSFRQQCPNERLMKPLLRSPQPLSHTTLIFPTCWRICFRSFLNEVLFPLAVIHPAHPFAKVVARTGTRASLLPAIRGPVCHKQWRALSNVLILILVLILNSLVVPNPNPDYDFVNFCTGSFDPTQTQVTSSLARLFVVYRSIPLLLRTSS